MPTFGPTALRKYMCILLEYNIYTYKETLEHYASIQFTVSGYTNIDNIYL